TLFDGNAMAQAMCVNVNKFLVGGRSVWLRIFRAKEQDLSASMSEGQKLGRSFKMRLGQSKNNIGHLGNCRSLGAAAVLLLFGLMVQSFAQTSSLSPEFFGSNGSGHFKFRLFQGEGVESGGKNSANSNTVQHWKGTFRWQGQQYAFSMVGTDPAHGSATTT